MQTHKTLFMLRKVQFLFIFSALFFASCGILGTKTIPASQQYVVMLSMDGFRWDYASRVETPWLDFIATNGVNAEYSKPAFPTKTFPNHYSMATGLYPNNHGIVDNNFTCPVNGTFRLGDRIAVENGNFFLGEPIWVTAEKQDVTTASYFWVGSEAPVQGIQPTYWKPYDGRVPFTDRMDTVIAWLRLEEQYRPRLITFYFQEPDSQGHATGPESPEIDKLVMELDSLIGVFITDLKTLPFYDKINLIVTSDHGMTQVSPDRYVDIASYTPRDWYERSHGGNPMLHVTPKEGMMDSVMAILKNVDNISVWKKEDLPARLNYGSSDRIEQVIILADSTWSLGWGKPRASYYTGGAHGWDNAKKDMHTIFYAMGPAFRKGHKHPAIEVVDLYPLIARIMGLSPARVDGKMERVAGMLK
jgi:predicted AlkP superfamily pyrophosphatase or phosphodiesterase